MARKRRMSLDDSYMEISTPQVAKSQDSRKAKKQKIVAQPAANGIQLHSAHVKPKNSRKKARPLTQEEEAYADGTPAERKARRNHEGLTEDQKIRLHSLLPEHLRPENKPSKVELISDSKSDIEDSSDESESEGELDFTPPKRQSPTVCKTVFASAAPRISVKSQVCSDKSTPATSRSGVTRLNLNSRATYNDIKSQRRMHIGSAAERAGLLQRHVIRLERRFVWPLWGESNAKRQRIERRHGTEIVFLSTGVARHLIECQITGSPSGVKGAINQISACARARRLRYEAAQNRPGPERTLRAQLLWTLRNASTSKEQRKTLRQLLSNKTHGNMDADTVALLQSCAPLSTATTNTSTLSDDVETLIHSNDLQNPSVQQIDGASSDDATSDDATSDGATSDGASSDNASPSQPLKANSILSTPEKLNKNGIPGSKLETSSILPETLTSGKNSRNALSGGSRREQIVAPLKAKHKQQSHASFENGKTGGPSTISPQSSNVSIIPEGATVIKIEDEDDEYHDSAPMPTTSADPELQNLAQDFQALFTEHDSEMSKLKRYIWMLEYVLDYEGVSKMQIQLIKQRCNKPKNGTWDNNCLTVLAHPRRRKN